VKVVKERQDDGVYEKVKKARGHTILWVRVIISLLLFSEGYSLSYMYQGADRHLGLPVSPLTLPGGVITLFSALRMVGQESYTG